MKKITLIIFTLILLGFPINTCAASEGSFIITGTSDEKYTFDMFNVGNTTTDMNNIAYTGYKLSDFLVLGTPKSNGVSTYGSFKWEDPSHVIINGEQEVKLIYHDNFFNKDVVFSVKIFGKSNNTVIESNNKNITTANTIRNTFNREIIHDGKIGCDILDVFPKLSFYDFGGREISGKFTFPDWDNTKVGTFDFTWVFTPDDKDYEAIVDTIKIKLLPKLEEEIDEPTIPSLTVTSILLDSKLSYDINLNNKISGSSYKWTSGNPKVAKVNAKNGLVTAISEGETIVTCEITLPDNSTQKLESLVIVGYDENAPLLTETELELEVGEKFTIGVENLVKGSKTSWKSSDKSIVKISSSKGKVTTINEGEAYVTCTITTPQNQVIVLKCDISVTK